MKRSIALLFSILGLAAFAQTASAAPLYAPIYSDDLVLGLDYNTGGAISTMPGSPFGVPAGGTTGFATTPDGKKGFAAYLFNPGVRGVSIDAAGAVVPAQDKIDLGNNGVYNVAVSRTVASLMPPRGITRDQVTRAFARFHSRTMARLRRSRDRLLVSSGISLTLR